MATAGRDMSEPTEPTPPRSLRTRDGRRFRLPLFLPVYQARRQISELRIWSGEPEIEGCILNAFFLYKQRELRERFRSGLSLQEFLAFRGLIATDSGAFQGFTRKLLLNNRDIVKFQDRMGSDIIAPLDLITPPGDNRSTATAKLATTQKRIREALGLVERGILAGVQQGGRFLDLRRQSVEELLTMGVEYLAIGSLVPFFNKNHDLEFTARVMRDARRLAGPALPIHVYGAGDPVEIPFMVALGVDIFDSSSYAHYAKGGWYMTPFGALNELGPLLADEYTCPCPVCHGADPAAVFDDPAALLQHNLWTIFDTLLQVRRALDEDSLEAMLEDILERHAAWFPDSRLGASWEAVSG